MRYVQIRVGVSAGPVVSNVIGSLNPRYGLFGDTVNTASRMESNSMPGKIHCSLASAKLLEIHAPDIPVKLRGTIKVKGKGKMKTFWVGNENDTLTAAMAPNPMFVPSDSMEVEEEEEEDEEQGGSISELPSNDMSGGSHDIHPIISQQDHFIKTDSEESHNQMDGAIRNVDGGHTVAAAGPTIDV